MAVVRSDPFRDYDRFFQQLFGGSQGGPRQMTMPLDALRKGDQFLIMFDLPGVASDSVELTVEDNVLTVKAERPAPPSEDVEILIAERPYGTFSRQVFLGENLDTENVQATYESGVLTLSIPVVPHAKSRRIQIVRREASTAESAIGGGEQPQAQPEGQEQLSST